MTEVASVALRMENIHKRFGAVRALAGVSFDVNTGEVHALIGENGAGKSTLMKVLSGAYTPDAGTMDLFDRPYAPRDPHEARARGVAMIYQELTLAPHLTVAQNIVLGMEPSRCGLVSRDRVMARAAESLAVLDQAELQPSRLVGELSPSARQLVEVARALAANARVVVMDEPTSSLSHRETLRLFEVIERLARHGVAVVYISHFLEEVRRVAQRYTVLRDGRSVATGTVPPWSVRDEGFNTRVIEAMAGRTVGELYPRVAHRPGEVLLEIEGLSGERAPREASLTLHRGEILGVAGLVGAGRTELLRAVFGLDAVRAGRVRVAGNWDHGKRPLERLSQGVGLLSEDRKTEGLALGLSVGDNVTLSRPIARFGILARGQQQRVVAALAKRLAVRYRAVDQPVGELSGGNQQKVALARLLHHDVDVLLLDEPTRGIDIASKAEVYRLMGELARQGKAVLFVSSYLSELLGVCDRIAVMSRGKLGTPRPTGEWSEARLLEEATGAASV